MGNRINLAILGFLVFFVLFTLTFVNHFQLQSQNQPKTRQITRNSGDEIESQWSPNDRMISFGAVRESSQNVGVIDLQTGQENLLTEDLKLLHATCWSPEGNQIAYSTGTQGKRGFIFHMHTISLVDGKIRALTSGPHIDGSPSWSPDGKHIAFDFKRSGNSDIWIKSIKGEQPIQVTFDPGDDVRPSWSNDGSKIAFGSSRSGNMDILVKDIDGFWSKSKK